MPTILVAKSDALQAWAVDVGLTKHVFWVGVSEEPAKVAVASLNARRLAGRDDWRLLGQRAVDQADEATIRARLAARETRLDPAYYPQLKGADGLFKVKPANVENQLLVRRALAGELPKAVKLKPADFAQYLLANCTDEREG